MTTGLLEEYRPAWEITPGWEIRTAGGQWVRVTAWFEYTSSDLTQDNVVVLHLEDLPECRVWSHELVMTRCLPDVGDDGMSIEE
jgi:hypothetical protein